jgi:flagellar motor switch protein FliN/FliY
MSDFDLKSFGEGDTGENDALRDVYVEISVVLGTHSIRVKNLLQVGRGAEIYLNRLVNEPVDVFANEVLIARGEVSIIGEKVGVTIIEMVKSQ